MSLQQYKKKRDFKQTPEPQSKKESDNLSLSFVVQRHDARNLHYDLRLEMDGVLKSWAVPKGPSMVAGDKRLAIMVEDHPLDYGEFYGQIPKGNYGAGQVDIWDEGTYTSMEEEEDAHKVLSDQLEKGNLKFILFGKHLKGKFALVRLKDQENQWLLIKKDDEFARKTFDVEKIKPLRSGKAKTSKSSGKSVGTEKEKVTQVQETHQDFPTDIPQPMLAKPSTQVVDKPSWLYEPKYDGYRIISIINKGDVNLYSRNGNLFNQKYESITKELGKIKADVILDGEVVIENSGGISDFQLLQNYNTTKSGVLKYFVFDILYLNGNSIIDFPLLQRKELLEVFFKKYKLKSIYNTPYRVGKGKELFSELAAKGYEGIIAKAPDSSYLPGKRADSWLKVKATLMQEAIICGYTMPQKGRKYFGSLILGIYDKGEIIYAGNCGTGFNDDALMELHTEFEKLKTESSPFKHPPKLSYTKGKPVWVKPEMVCNIKYTEWSQEGRFRHPVFMGILADKNAEQVVKEAPKTIEVKKKDTVVEKTISIDGKKVKCTNLTKVYWPDEGYTKGDLIAYYQGISKFILPYLKDRPQSLNRHPNGIKGKSFYHKNMEVKQLPEWVKTFKVQSDSKKSHIDYLICNDPATLIYMANLGCIEINPWHSTWQEPEKPTYMMLDLDPGEISFKEVVNTALVIKELCDQISIPCYCKTSGATGLHIFIPLGGRYNYLQIKTFAEILAGITHHRLPHTTSIERSTAKRKDKIYVDFLQNRKGQTIAAPYSVRPRPLATVSAPLHWKEVNHNLSPQMFTIKNMMERMDKIGDIWNPVLKEVVILDKALKAIENFV